MVEGKERIRRGNEVSAGFRMCHSEQGQEEEKGVKWRGRTGEEEKYALTEETRGGRDRVDEGARKAGTKDHKDLYDKLRDLCLS